MKCLLNKIIILIGVTIAAAGIVHVSSRVGSCGGS